jgi:hypothetical protein
MSLASVGEVWNFCSTDVALTMTIVDVVKEHSETSLTCKVLLLDVSRGHLARAKTGQTTDWLFNCHETEWKKLRRIA